MRRPVKVIAQRIEYISPSDCGSSVGFTLIKGRRLHGELDLSDCNRKINWYFRNETASLAKIDLAIAVLQDFRAQFAAARRRKRNVLRRS